MDSLKQWYSFWFKYGSPVTMGVFRILMGGLILLNLINIAPFFSDWFDPYGYLPANISGYALDGHVRLGQDSGLHLVRINLLQGVESPALIAIFYGVTMLAALFTCIGYWTRISSIVLAIGIVTIHHRTTLVLHGGDTVMRIMAIYMAIAPSGAAVSLDRLFAVRKGKAPAIPPLVSMWPQRLIAYNCSLIYLTTTWAKWFGQLWKSGDAAWYPARLNEFERFPVPSFLNDYPVVKFATYGTLAVEFGLATLVWFKPLRKWVLLAGVGLHLYIDYSMNIPLFSYLMMSMYVAFYEGDEVAAWWDRVKLRFKRTA
jgi:Vitamin K-dependent gamma-carboxylase